MKNLSLSQKTKHAIHDEEELGVLCATWDVSSAFCHRDHSLGLARPKMTGSEPV